jgi:uncharacterized protein (AIM24 family)
MIHGDFNSFAESTRQDPFTLQNKKLLKVFLPFGPVKARTGSMVAYQGEATFAGATSGGMKKMFKAAVTSEGVDLMDVTGSGELFLADRAREIQVFYLENDMISVSGRSVLAFSASIEYDIQRVGGGIAGMAAGGLYNTTLRGSGYVAVTSDGDPIAFDVGQGNVFADPSAVVLWTAGVQMNIKSDVSMKSLMRGGSGEEFQMAFSGQGWVMVQPSENIVQGA